MTAVQIEGFTTANIAEVEANTKALRTTLRPEDFGSLGIYSLSSPSGIMSAAANSGIPIFSFRWTQASNLALVKRVMLSAGVDTTSFGASAGSAVFNLFIARSFTVVDSGGTSILPSSTQNKLRTSMGGTLLGDVRIASTGTLTAGTRTLDTNPAGTLVCGIASGAGAAITYGMVPLFDQRPGEHPIVLAQNEGLIIQVTNPATGTWKFGVKIDWSEVTSY